MLRGWANNELNFISLAANGFYTFSTLNKELNKLANSQGYGAPVATYSRITLPEMVSKDKKKDNIRITLPEMVSKDKKTS